VCEKEGSQILKKRKKKAKESLCLAIRFRGPPFFSRCPTELRPPKKKKKKERRLIISVIRRFIK